MNHRPLCAAAVVALLLFALGVGNPFCGRRPAAAPSPSGDAADPDVGGDRRAGDGARFGGGAVSAGPAGGASEAVPAAAPSPTRTRPAGPAAEPPDPAMATSARTGRGSGGESHFVVPASLTAVLPGRALRPRGTDFGLAVAAPGEVPDPDSVGPCPQGGLPRITRRGRDEDGLATWWHEDGSITKRGLRDVGGARLPFVMRIESPGVETAAR